MNRTRRFHLPTIALIALCASCSADREARENEPADSNLPVTRIADDEPTLPLGDIELSLDVASRDARGLPKQIRITFRSRSAQRGCLALPRPVVEEQDFNASLPCLMVGMRETGGNDSSPGEPVFLYTMSAGLYTEARGSTAGPREGVYLDPGTQWTRTYDLSAFCIIGHGIAPKPEANFSTCYQAGDQPSELRAYLVTDWNNLTRIESKPIAVRSSELDFSVREKLGDD
jgi:hypothetical protein